MPAKVVGKVLFEVLTYNFSSDIFLTRKSVNRTSVCSIRELIQSVCIKSAQKLIVSSDKGQILNYQVWIFHASSLFWGCMMQTQQISGLNWSPSVVFYRCGAVVERLVSALQRLNLASIHLRSRTDDFKNSNRCLTFGTKEIVSRKSRQARCCILRQNTWQNTDVFVWQTRGGVEQLS